MYVRNGFLNNFLKNGLKVFLTLHTLVNTPKIFLSDAQSFVSYSGAKYLENLGPNRDPVFDFSYGK